jgi:oligopeptide/dipeptide ABC transporter ATP-binding protein
MTAGAESDLRHALPPARQATAPPVPPGEPVLDIRDLSISYASAGGDVRAVRNVDLTLHRGEVIGLAGESGCGKSTLAYGAVRLLRPPAMITSGSVTYHGRRAGTGDVDVLAASAERLRALRWREIAIVFQSAMNGLNPVLRVRDQLLDALEAHALLTTPGRHDRVVDLIEMVGIPRARLGSYPHELSGGMRQRVMIAMALAAEPEVVIMDEPTTALDVVVQREILAEIFELRERLGFSVVFITHDLSLLLEIADRIVIMYAGQLVESGTREQIRTHAGHPYTQGLLTSFPRLRGPRQRLLGIPGSPPDLRGALLGCPFRPRCRFATDDCAGVDMRLIGAGAADPAHVTACPFVTAGQVDPVHAAAAAQRGASAVIGATTPSQSDAEADGEASLAGTGQVALEAMRLDKRYRLGRGRHAVVISAAHEVSLELRRGTIVALVGESGSGKTTVARLLAGQESRSGGQIELDGKPINPAAHRGFRAYKSEVQMVFQDPFASLNPVHTVRYHLERALRVHRKRTGLASNQVTAELDRLLTQVRLTPPESFRDAYPHELSGGQRQRVAIARALAASPRVLLADEPVSMLDVSIRLEVLDLIDDLRRRLDLAVLYITHDIASARYFADQILVMYAGEIVERGPAEQVTQNPSHPYTQLLISAAPDPDAFGRQLQRDEAAAARRPSTQPRVPTGEGCRFAPRCPHAQVRCETQPPLIETGPGRGAACWLLDGAAPETEAPGPEGARAMRTKGGASR